MRDRLPLLYRTPVRWTNSALSNIELLLSDHAYLERKAASNALELLNRWPAPDHPDKWTILLTGIARDEALHLQAVVKLIHERGFKMERLHRSQYANDLRRLVRAGEGPKEIADRLLISGLIEARSCERFDLLAGAADEELADFYKGLAACEWGHYRVFLELAESVLPKSDVQARWQELLALEAITIQSQPVGPRLHSAAEPILSTVS